MSKKEYCQRWIEYCRVKNIGVDTIPVNMCDYIQWIMQNIRDFKILNKIKNDFLYEKQHLQFTEYLKGIK